jgi:hypothetical protein
LFLLDFLDLVGSRPRTTACRSEAQHEKKENKRE